MEKLKAKISLPNKNYKSDQDIILNFELYNPNDEGVYALTWYTPLEGLWSDCFKVTRNGESVPYDGPLAKRGQPTAEDYVFINGGGSVSKEVSIGQAYQVSEEGEYEAKLVTNIVDYVQIETKELNSKTLENSSARENIQSIESNALHFTVEAGENRKATSGESVRSLSKVSTSTAGAKDPIFDGGNNSQQDEVKKAHFDSFFLIEKSLSSLADDRKYKEWFGSYDNARFNKVKDVYSKIKDRMEGTAFTYVLSGSGCKRNTYAYTYKGSDKIWLCDLFWKADPIGTDSKAGTMVHEHAHASASIDDIVYGQAKARKLAQDEPEKAIKNADNYEYYSEPFSDDLPV
ncbi:M35 family metallopeptidase [Porifericola rhodea]|uniref:M35 family metallopeptidase n=1 Tax=Porifericola rhodea TaxID=930972 RepID=UPI0026651FFA|nr:M35 family metallopeptidase [Porifericola rhodea]WKN33779.1 M35 family metallopeptidase [Porifericola rhodea]